MVDFLYWGKKIGGFAWEAILNDLKDPSKYTKTSSPNFYNTQGQGQGQDPNFNYEKIIKAIIDEFVRCTSAKWYHQQKKNKGNGTES